MSDAEKVTNATRIHIALYRPAVVSLGRRTVLNKRFVVVVVVVVAVAVAVAVGGGKVQLRVRERRTLRRPRAAAGAGVSAVARAVAADSGAGVGDRIRGYVTVVRARIQGDGNCVYGARF